MDYEKRLQSIVFLMTVPLVFLIYNSPDVNGNEVYYVTGAGNYIPLFITRSIL